MKGPRDIEELVGRLAGGETFRYLFFWGHRPRQDGQMSSSCFSQWFDAPFVLDGQRYATAEHFMMAEKARLFRDDKALAQVLAAATPALAKSAGRKVQRFDETEWTAHRFDIVLRANRAKFGQNPSMAAFLSRTEDHVLVEASPYDRIWGIGMGAGDARAQDPTTWQGLNLLGFALMQVREELRAGRLQAA